MNRQKEYHKEYYQRPEVKEQVKKYRKEWNKKNREKNRLFRKRYFVRLRNIIDQIKQGQSCVECGEDDPCCLDFNHLEDKKFNIGSTNRGNVGIDTLIREIEKCEILCANCHRKKEKMRDYS